MAAGSMIPNAFAAGSKIPLGIQMWTVKAEAEKDLEGTLRKLHALRLREPRIEKRVEAVERQVQRVQQQVRGLVVGIGRPVPEGKLRFAEARDGVAQPVADGLEIVRRCAHRVS